MDVTEICLNAVSDGRCSSGWFGVTRLHLKAIQKSSAQTRLKAGSSAPDQSETIFFVGDETEDQTQKALQRTIERQTASIMPYK